MIMLQTQDYSRIYKQIAFYSECVYMFLKKVLYVLPLSFSYIFKFLRFLSMININ